MPRVPYGAGAFFCSSATKSRTSGYKGRQTMVRFYRRSDSSKNENPRRGIPLTSSRTKLSFFILILTATPSLAYVDPGTAGLLFQMGYIVVSSIIAGLAFFFRPIKAFFLKIFGKAKRPEVSQDSEDDDGESLDS